MWTQTEVLCLQYVTWTNTIHRVGQDCHLEQFGTPCSPNNAPQSREIHPRGSTASAKAICKSRFGNLCMVKYLVFLGSA